MSIGDEEGIRLLKKHKKTLLRAVFSRAGLIRDAWKEET